VKFINTDMPFADFSHAVFWHTTLRHDWGVTGLQSALEFATFERVP